MFRYIALLLLTALSYTSFAQAQVEIGKALGGSYIITADTLHLKKALQRTMGDGSVINRMHIESMNAFHYLVGDGVYKGYYRMIAVSLSYNAPTRVYYAEPLSHVTCSSAACGNCTPFQEKGRIIGCKCIEKSTVSNQCNFSVVEASPFFSNLLRARMMDKKK